jgi:hypothetical protein
MSVVSMRMGVPRPLVPRKPRPGRRPQRHRFNAPAPRTGPSHSSSATTRTRSYGTCPCRCCFNAVLGNERRAVTPSFIRKLLITTIAAAGLTDIDGNPLVFQPHDFRRIFVTDAIMNGLPPHIAQVICGTRASTPRWATRPYTPPKRSKPTAPSSLAAAQHVPVRNIAHQPTRNGTPSSHTSRSARCPSAHVPGHSVRPDPRTRVRCSLLRPDPTQRGRLEEIRDNLEARIIEAKREGWLGEVEGLQVSYTGVRDKLAQIDTTMHRAESATELGMPGFDGIAGRTSNP